MINVKYKIYDGKDFIQPWPSVVRQTFNNDVLISEEEIDSSEAELAEVDIDSYFDAYKAYIFSYLESLTSYDEETSVNEMDSHMNLHSATSFFRSFMMPKWVGDEV